MLGRPEAAAYLGVSIDTFDYEVRSGMWPSACRRGRAGGRLTWDRLILDRAADLMSGLKGIEAAENEPTFDVVGFDMAAMLKAKLNNGTTSQQRH